jgi:hypothetical protein
MIGDGIFTWETAAGQKPRRYFRRHLVCDGVQASSDARTASEIAMRELRAEPHLRLRLNRLTGTAAIYGSFVLIAAVVIGSLSVHPF